MNRHAKERVTELVITTLRYRSLTKITVDQDIRLSTRCHRETLDMLDCKHKPILSTIIFKHSS